MRGSCRGKEASRQFLEEAQEAWRLLSDDERQAWGERARQSNARKAALQLAAAAQQQPDVRGGPWNLSVPSGQWPLSEECMTEYLSSHQFDATQRRWAQAGWIVIVSVSFPSLCCVSVDLCLGLG